MKIKQLSLNNFGNFGEITVSFDENVTYLVGNNGAGKSSIGLTAIWFLFQGIAEKQAKGKDVLIGERFRFIGNNGKSASGQIILVDGDKEIIVNRKITKEAQFLSFVAPEGMQLDQSWLDDLFNVFMVNPKRFTALSPKEQALALGIDTSKWDAELKTLRSQVVQNRTAIKTIESSIAEFPSMDEMTVPDDPNELKAELDRINTENNSRKKTHESEKETEVKKYQRDHLEWETNVRVRKDLMEKIKELEYQLKELKATFTGLPAPTEEPTYPIFVEIEYIPTEELTAKWKQALEQTANAKQIETVRRLQAQKEKLLQEIETLTAKGKTTQQERQTFISNFKLPDKSLTINEDGELLLRDKPIKEPYWSTGELARIVPVIMSSVNNELKYVFIQDFNNLDDENRQKVVKYLTEKGFQLVIELISEAPKDKHVIHLKECKIESDEQEGVL